MDFKQLESFIAIAKLKSFSKAADSLYLTQPTISNHIHHLEESVGTSLFHRHSKEIALTPAGDILFDYALGILNQRERALFSLNAYMGRIEGTLEIASSSIPECHYLAQVLPDFSKKYPDVSYRLTRHDTQDVFNKLTTGEIDFGFVGAKVDHSPMEFVEIMTDDIVLVGPSTSSYDNLSSVDIDGLKSLPLLLRKEGSGTRKALEDALKEKGHCLSEFSIVAEVENTETIKALIEANLGISFLSKRSVQTALMGGSLQEICIDNFSIHRQFYFTYHGKRTLNPLSETFRKFILDFSSQHTQG